MDINLANISQFFKSALGGNKEGSILGIDIGASSAKIVQLRASRGTAVLETYGEIAFGPYGGQSIGKAVKLTPEKIAEALSDLMREANVTARVGGLSIPFSARLLSVLKRPKEHKDSLKRRVPIEGQIFRHLRHLKHRHETCGE